MTTAASLWDYAEIGPFSPPYKTEFKVGEALNLDGLCVWAIYYAAVTGRTLQYFDEIAPQDYPEYFTVTTNYDSAVPGVYAVWVEYSPGAALGRENPAAPAYLVFEVEVC